MTQEYEYVVVKLELIGRRKDGDRLVTEQLNRIAAHGWRLVAVTHEAVEHVAYFERRKGADGE